MLVRSKKVKEDCELSTVDSPDSPAVCESTTSTNQLLQSSGPYCDEYILDWTDVQRINWNIIFLLGGAFALSSALLYFTFLLISALLCMHRVIHSSGREDHP